MMPKAFLVKKENIGNNGGLPDIKNDLNDPAVLGVETGDNVVGAVTGTQGGN